MKIEPFKLERYFVPYEFTAKYLLSSSDCDGLSQKELVVTADRETRVLWDNLTLGYTESAGNPYLRKEIAGLYKNIDPGQVLVVTPEEGILIAMSTMLNKGDHMICTFPGYQSLYETAKSKECEVTFWQPDEATGWRFDPAFLEKQIKKNTKLLVINFPHNPTGFLPSKKEFEQTMAVAKAHKLKVFSDEMYWLLEYDPQNRLPAACEVYDQAVSLFGMSKTFGMAGVRIGWLVTQDQETFQNCATFKDYTTICSSAPSEILSIIALRAKDVIIQRHLERIRRNLKVLDGFFDRHQDQFVWTRPRAGTIGLVRLKGEVDSLAFCQDVIDKTGIMLLPSTVYDFGNQHFRIGFGRDNMPEVVGKFEEYLEVISKPSLNR